MNTESIAQQLAELKAKIKDLESQIELDCQENFLTFDVVLRVKTKASTWCNDFVDSEIMREHFNNTIDNFADTLCFDIEDSVTLQKITPVLWTLQIGNITLAKNKNKH